LKRSPFYELHVKAGAKMASRAWATPMEYVGVKEEHEAVRQRAGIIDFSSMGEISIKGKDALSLVQKLIVNDASRLTYGKVLYSSMLNEKGGMVDDTTVYCFSNEHYWIVTSTAGRFKDFKWITEKAKDMNVGVEDISSGIGLLCFQGPLSREILQNVTGIDLQKIKYFEFGEGKIGDTEVLVSRTGFTGELGYEIYVRSEDAYELWDTLIEAGKPYDVLLCGMGAGSGILPLEKGYLSGREYNEDINPIEAGLGWTVRWNKGDFIGKSALLEIKEKGISKTLIGFEMEDASKIAKPGNVILSDGKEIGKVTSGNYSYSVEKSIGMGYVPIEYSKIGAEIEIDLGNEKAKGIQVKKPFYDPKGERLRV
jgi:aminomethyltransferase